MHTRAGFPARLDGAGQRPRFACMDAGKGREQDAEALLVERPFTVPMLKTQVIAVVEFADSLFPVQCPGFECFVTATGVEVIPTHMGPAKCQQDRVG